MSMLVLIAQIVHIDLRIDTPPVRALNVAQSRPDQQPQSPTTRQSTHLPDLTSPCVYITYTTAASLWVVSIPVTARLDEATVEALDKAVIAGLARTRGAIVSAAVADWLDRHSEESIVASYQHRYANPDPEVDQLVAKLGAFSAAACLAADTH